MYVTIGNLDIYNLVMWELVALIRVLATLGYNASVGIDSVVEILGFMAIF
jgi:hypothetical protein